MVWRMELGLQIGLDSPGETVCYIQCLEKATNGSDPICERGFLAC